MGEKKARKAQSVKGWVAVDPVAGIRHYDTLGYVIVYRTQAGARESEDPYERIAHVEVREI